ncbi:MAG: hypothetical protein IJE08_02110 [Clostridia bacterium]|nr:hypothetical protein [Clostridia bacterium]
MNAFPAEKCLEKLELKRLGRNEQAGVAICSLPVPEGLNAGLTFKGYRASVKPIGLWQDGKSPRRLLMTADAGNCAPETLAVSREKPDEAFPEIHIEMDRFAVCDDPAFMWERHAAKITWGGKSIGLIMGMRTRGEIHWWEACRLQILDQDEFCTTVQIGGAIPTHIYDRRDLDKYNGYYENPFLHKHHWLNGRFFARLYANGVCEIYAHHINSKFFDEGLDLEDCVPVIGFMTYDAKTPDELCGEWKGDRDRLTIGHAELDVTEAARLATEKQPGQFMKDERYGAFVWQPYMGAELYGGRAVFPSSGGPDGYVFRAEEKRFPRGFARTVRFSLSLSDRSPVIARYLPPAWWYGLCAEFMADNLLPASSGYDMALERAMDYVREFTVEGGFEDGSTARYRRLIPDGSGRRDPSWEGELPHGQFLWAWRSGNAEDYDRAMRAAFCFDDVYVDHASSIVRMHGWAPPATAVPMFRMQGTIAAFLETGDITLYEDSMGVIDNAYRMHKNSWPRMCVGRDASFIRGAMMMYRYFNDRHYLNIARDAMTDVALSQRPDGSFGDQGGGSGIHQWSGYITKPWMGCMAVGGLVDYLEMFPEDNDDTRPVWNTVLKFADWLLSERFFHAGKMPEQKGVFDDPDSDEDWPVGYGWSYQHYFKGQSEFYEDSKWFNLKREHQDFWHWEYLARILTYCSVRTGEMKYFDAWAESADLFYAVRKKAVSDHDAAQSLQYIPWMMATAVGARYTEEGVLVNAPKLGGHAPKRAVVFSPDGPVEADLT